MNRLTDEQLMAEWHRWREAAHNSPKSVAGKESYAWAANSRRWADCDRERARRGIPFPARDPVRVGEVRT